jgi:3-oxoacyl-[acyl-carrier-protein] synthase II
MNPTYIISSACISPQSTWDADVLGEPVPYTGNRLKSIEPEYTKWVDAKQIRRMSRVMKMGAAAAMLALKKSEVTNPDAIITGTGLGCLDDTGNFLGKITEFKEEALNPTPFIQSTHNTIGSHVAFLLQCQQYNQTYSHGAFSFESALLDTMLQISENPELKILTGAADEIIDYSHTIYNRLGIFRRDQQNTLDLFKSPGTGTLHGEGSAWFVLSGKPDASAIQIKGVKTLYKATDTEKQIQNFLSDSGVSQVDLVLSGKSGDVDSDEKTNTLVSKLFDGSSTGVYKHLCGEYHTSTAFALWLANSILKSGTVPATVLERGSIKSVNNILILNQYFNDHQSLILVTRE